MLLVMPYFASMPMFLSILFAVGGDATRLVVRFETPYGFSSMLREGGGTSSPTSVASLASRCTELFAGVPGGVIDSSECSLTRRSHRRALMPQTCSFPVGWRSDLNGMTLSDVQPVSSRCTFTSQTAFQS